jgi:hypothetical protein
MIQSNAQYESCSKYTNLPPGKISSFSEASNLFPWIKLLSMRFGNNLNEKPKFFSFLTAWACKPELSAR